MKGCILLFLLAALSVLYFSTFGFPEWLVAKGIASIKSDNFVVEVSRGKLDLLRGIVLHDVRLYRKGLIGPPVVNAEKVVAGLDVLGFLGGGLFLDRFKLSEGELRPVMLRDLRPSSRDDTEGIQILIELEEFLVQGLGIEEFSGELITDPKGLKVEDVEFTVTDGNVRGPATGAVEYDAETGNIAGRIETQFDPHILLEFLEARGMSFTQALIKRFSFGELPPRFDMTFERDAKGLLDVSGRFWMQDCLYRRVDLMRADGSIDVVLSPDERVVTMKKLLLVRKEGNLRTSFRYEMGSGLVSFDASSALHPPALMQMVNVCTNLVEYLSFDGPVYITGNGTADTRSLTNMNFELNVDGRGIGLFGLVTETSHFGIQVQGSTGQVSRLNGRLYGGEFDGSATFFLADGAETNTRYSIEGEVRDADATSVRLALMKEPVPEGKRGTLSARGSVSGLLGEYAATTMKGGGSIRVKDSQIFSLPVFGELSALMKKVIPGLGFVLSQSDVKTEFTIAEGKVTTEKILIEGDVLSMSGKGSYAFTGDVAFDVQLRLMKAHTVVGKLMRLITYPISKLFEFRLRGTMDEPRWYPVNFSSDLLEKVGLRDAK